MDLEHFKRLRLPISVVKRGEPPRFWEIKEDGNVTIGRDQTIRTNTQDEDPSFAD